MQHLPINLLSLHAHEEDLRSKSLAAIQADRDLSRHLQAAHDAMEYLDVVRQQPATVNTDEHALTCLGLRLFNLGATTLKLSMSGYYQAAFALLRDAFEIVNLLDLFRIDQSAILVWRTADDKVQRLEFMPVKVREKLAKHPDFKGQQRHPIYERYSGYANHVTFKSFNLLMMGGLVQGGPFYDLPRLKAVLEDLAAHISHATLALGILVHVEDMPTRLAKREFLEKLRAYHQDYIKRAAAGT